MWIGARRHRPRVLRSVYQRTLREQARALVGWSAGFALFAAAMLAIFPSVRGNAALAKLLDAYPAALRSMFGVSDYTTGPGYLRAELFSFTSPLLLLLLAVLWASDVTAGEEERGSLDVLLANPISRRRVLVEKWAAVTTGVTAVAGVFGLVLGVGDWLLDMRVGAGDLVASLLATTLLGVCLGTLALAVAAATGHRGVARGVTVAVAVAAYLVSSLSGLVPALRSVRFLSPWYHALGVDPMTAGLTWHLLVLVALTVVLAGLSVMAFDRRDLGVS